MTAYQPRSSVVPPGMSAGQFHQAYLMPHWTAAGATGTVRFFLTTLWWFHSSGSTYAALSTIADRMGAPVRTAERAQAWAVEHGLLTVTKEGRKQRTVTVRTIVLPVDRVVDNPVDNGSERPDETSGRTDVPRRDVGSTPTRRRVDPDETSGPSEAYETYETKDRTPQVIHRLALDAVELDDRYLLARPSEQACVREEIRRLIEDEGDWVALVPTTVIAEKALTQMRAGASQGVDA